MDLKLYLQTFSKEELISLIAELADGQEAVRHFLNERIFVAEGEVVHQNNSSNAEKNSLPVESGAIDSSFQNPVTRHSSPQEKINLFKSIFAGRNDVFALRWYNAKNQKSGYSPVCGNKWIIGKCDLKKFSCATCPYKLPVALSDNYFFNHLAGRDEFCRDVIGLYPLMEGNLCRFLVMDFDAHVPPAKMSAMSTHANAPTAAYNHLNESKAWKKDILTVQKIFSDYGISSYIEISRSGNGGHLWIFFENEISARLARNLGSAVIKSAMQKRHSIPFESFDRLFPNQDEIPKGGYGNLIALPLQGKAVKEGHSVFVNDNFIPYDNQWQFLSSVQKVSEKHVKKIINEIEGSLFDFVEKDETEEIQTVQKKIATPLEADSKTKEALKKSDFKNLVQIILLNHVKIKKEGISENALEFLSERQFS